MVSFISTEDFQKLFENTCDRIRKLKMASLEKLIQSFPEFVLSPTSEANLMNINVRQQLRILLEM
jgi:hypothetical protein